MVGGAVLGAASGAARDVLLVGSVVATAAAAAAVSRSRRRRVPAPSGRDHIPERLERTDWPDHDGDWLVVVFASRTCDSCRAVLAAAAALASEVVSVVQCFEDDPLQRRYGIDAVPLTLVVDRTGVVRDSFLGPVASTTLWSAVARVRESAAHPGGEGPKL